VWPIIQANCQVCHTNGIGSVQVPDMILSSPDAALAAWINQRAHCNPNLIRVVPGNSGMSLEFSKISQPVPFCGSPMPLLQPSLTTSEQQTIKEWIDEGAPNN
jgi:hypothetical protein